MAEVDGSHIANIDSNFNSTHSSINRSKGATPTQEYIKKLPESIQRIEANIAKNESQIKKMPNETAQDKHQIARKKDQIKKEKSKLKSLKSIDKKKMLNADKVARAENNRILAKEYYTSSKFLKNTAITTADTSFRMGLRESLGMVLTEIWFELREQLPKVYERCKTNFSFNTFLAEMKTILKNICNRVISRFKDILSTFTNSAVSGVFSNISTIILNTFLTTEKMIGKMIREMWSTVVKVSKLMFFNPDKLSIGALTKQVVKLLSAGIVLAVGLVINTHLASLMTFPFGAELAGFISALLTGLLTLGFTYFIEHSEVMKKVWSFLDRLKSKYKVALEHYEQINIELDQYLSELAKIELNMDPDDLLAFSNSLIVINCEYEKSELLNKEIAKRNIDLPFETDNSDSVRNWLSNL